MPLLIAKSTKPPAHAMFKFEHPAFFFFLLALPVLAGLVAWHRFARRRAEVRFGNPALVERLMAGFSWRRIYLKTSLFALALALLAVALANPQSSMKREKVKQKSADVFLLLDVSESMSAEDIAPNRLERAKIFAQKLIQNLPGQRVGLIFFAGTAQLWMPLSTDYNAAISVLQSADTDAIGEQGTAIGEALDLAEESFDPNVVAGRAVVVITDGETHDENALERAEICAKTGIQVHAIGAGTAAGAPIPVSMGINGKAWKKDREGNTVTTRLNEDLLRDLASAGGGEAHNLAEGDAVVAAIRSAVDRLEKREVEARSYVDFESYFQWLLLPAFLLLVLDFWLAWRKEGA